MKKNILLTFICFSLLVQLKAQDIQMGLVGYWPLDSSYLDASGLGNHGTAFGSPNSALDVIGTSNKSIGFNGTSQYIKVGDILDSVFAKSPTATFSVSFWAKTNQISATQGDNVIIAKSGGGASGPYQWYILHENNGNVAALISYNAPAASNFYEVKSAATIPVNTWFHAVMTYDGTQTNNANRIKIYVNKVTGVFSRSLGSGGTTTQNSTQEVTIGGTYSAGNPLNVYDGSVDEVRIYNRVLNAADIDTLYAYKNTLPSYTYKGLVAYWPLDSNANDLSGNGYHGTLLGAPTTTTDVNDYPFKAYAFNGTSQIIKCGDILDSVFARNPASKFSISFWAKTTQISATQGDNVLLAKSGAGSSGPYQWYMAHENNGAVVALVSYASTAATNFYEVKSSTTIGANEWFHAVMTYDGTLSKDSDRLKIFVNKQAGIYSRSLGSGGTTTLNSMQEVSIGGSYAPGPVNGYYGAMDEIRIYDYVLSGSEIDTLYAYKKAPAPYQPKGLVAYWPLDSNAKDYSGSGFHGTMVNGPAPESDVNGVLAAYGFNGTNQQIKCGDVLDAVFSQQPASKFSISFWANTLKYSTTQGDNVILAKSGGGSSGPYQWYVAHERDSSIVVFISYASSAGVNYYEVKSSTKVPINEWFHGIVTYDGSLDSNADRLKIFINKQLGIYSRSGGSGGRSTINSPQEITIGGTYSSSSPVNGYQGRIDEVRIYDIILKSSAMDSLYSYKRPVLPLPAPQGLIAYWPLDSNANDLSGNGYHGSIVGTPEVVADANNKVSKAYQFNGSTQLIKCGDILDSVFARHPESKFSISFWAKTSAFSNVQGDNVMIAKSGAGASGPYQWYVNHEKNGTVVALVSYSTQAATNFYEVKSPMAIASAEWFHTVLTYDGTLANNADRLKLFVNKVPGEFSRSTGPGGKTTTNTAQVVSIGGAFASGATANGYEGALDEIRMYDYVLSGNEIDTLYAYKKPIPPYQPKGLVAYWPLDSNMQDLSGNGYHGTVVAPSKPVAVSDVNGNTSKAYRFNGTDQYITCGDILDSLFTRSPATKFSISLWGNTNQISAVQGDNVLLAKSGAGSAGPYEWYIAHENNGTVVALVSYATTAATNFMEVKSTTSISANEWYHVVMTYDGTDTLANKRLKIYVNNIPGVYSRGMGLGGTRLSNTTQEITIGGTYASGFVPVNGFDGSMDEIRIYDDVLTIAQVDTLFQYKIPTGLKTESIFDQTLVFPNPTQDGRLKIEFNHSNYQNIAIEVMNAMGEVIHQANVKSMSDGIQLDLSNQSEGIYLVRLSANGSGRSFRVLVKK